MNSACEVILLDDDSTDLLILEMLCKKMSLTFRSFNQPQKVLDYLTNRSADRPFLLLSDIYMPEMSGLELLEKLKETFGHTPVVFISGNESIQGPVDAMRLGAYDFLLKPVNQELFFARIKKAIEHVLEKSEITNLKNNLYSGRSIKNFVGKSQVIKDVYNTVMRVGKFDSTVLISGESGVGKERVARAIHDNSARANGPFIAVNSASIPESLVESELFGYVKGSFTGANNDKVGLIEASSGGTLFLDEIGEIPLHLQAKLLRVLQEKVIRPVGGKENIKVDLRVVCATHRDLNKMVDDGEFREDLFYRLNVIPITIPPLRKRKEDLEFLIPFIANKLSDKWSVKKNIPQETFDYLMSYDWPGNIRELENILERAFVLAQGSDLLVSDFKMKREALSKTEEDYVDLFCLKSGQYLTLQELELKYIKEIMKRTSTKEEAARVLGIGRKTLYRKEELLASDI